MPILPTAQRTSKGKPEDNEREDYLQDPHLWRDKLPQPFRMIDHLLNELYANAWADIEKREIEQKHLAARVKVPELTDVAVIEGVQGVKNVCGGRDGLIFIGGRSGVSVFRGPVSGSDNEQEKVEKLAHCDTLTEVNSITVGWNSSIHFIATLHHKEVKVFALISNHLVFLTDVISMSEEEEDPTSPVLISISQSSSHLAVATTHPQDGMKLHVYRLPLTNWQNELNQFLERVTSVENEETKEDNEDIIYTKAAHLFTLSPPSPLTPCTAPNPTAALQSVCDGQRHHVPTGELHILRQCYFEKRRKAFISQRAHFVSTQRDTVNHQQSEPTCHFLYYKNACRQETPCFMAVWWQHHTQLFIYPLADSNKGPPLPHRVLPQASHIVATSVNQDTSRIAIGLQSGVISVWSLSTAVCIRVVSIRDVSETMITALLFVERGDTLCVGTSGGKVMAVSTLGRSGHGEPIAQLNQRFSKQAEAHSALFSSRSPYDTRSEVVSLKMVPTLNNVVASIHADGTLTMWSVADCEALCTLSESCLIERGQCSFTSDGTYAVMLSKQNESESNNCLMSVNLQALPTLTHSHITHHNNQPINIESDNMMLTVEAHLTEYTKRFMANESWKGALELLAL